MGESTARRGTAASCGEACLLSAVVASGRPFAAEGADAPVEGRDEAAEGSNTAADAEEPEPSSVNVVTMRLLAPRNRGAALREGEGFAAAAASFFDRASSSAATAPTVWSGDAGVPAVGVADVPCPPADDEGDLRPRADNAVDPFAADRGDDGLGEGSCGVPHATTGEGRGGRAKREPLRATPMRGGGVRAACDVSLPWGVRPSKRDTNAGRCTAVEWCAAASSSTRTRSLPERRAARAEEGDDVGKTLRELPMPARHLKSTKPPPTRQRTQLTMRAITHAAIPPPGTGAGDGTGYFVRRRVSVMRFNVLGLMDADMLESARPCVSASAESSGASAIVRAGCPELPDKAFSVASAVLDPESTTTFIVTTTSTAPGTAAGSVPVWPLSVIVSCRARKRAPELRSCSSLEPA